jgi:general secretion pathway protein A
VDAVTVRRAAAEVLGRPARPRWRWRRIAVAALVTVAGGAALLLLVPGELGQGEARRETVVARPAAPSLVNPARTGLEAAPAGASLRQPGARLGDLLRDETLSASRSDALAELLELWGVPVTVPRVDCGSPPLGMLECFTTVGTWRKLRRLDLPAALELVAASGARRYAVLTALTPSEATLRFRDRALTVPLPEVEAVWEGLFVVLWRPPPGPLPVRPGARGPAADWLREQLSRADGADLPIERGQPFDEALRRRVVAFQQARSLEPHGVVDRETAILLQGTERGADVPRLSGGTP